MVVCCLLAGCGSPGSGAAPAAKSPGAKKADNPRPKREPEPRNVAVPLEMDGSQSPPLPDPAPEPTGPAGEPEPGARLPRPRTPGNRPLLGDLLQRVADSESKFIANLPRMQVDEAKAAAEGIRKLSGKRLTLYTDLPPSKQVDCLVEVFDQAFPQWCEYFHIDPAEHADWHMTGFLMDEKAVYVRTGLLPADLPPFQHGYARNFELWLYEQPSEYYRRHLLLHEGTHGFMNTLLGACGPPWYMESTAELLGTHRWKDGRLTLNYMPASREETPHWGRIRIIKDAFAEHRAMHLKKVIEYAADAHLETEPYAWCWAAAALLDRHPRYQDRFRKLYKNVLLADFTERFYQSIGDDWDELREQWQVFVSGLEYGHDIPATAIDFSPGKAPTDFPVTVSVSAEKGWQNTGVQLQGGARYRLSAAGRYQVAERPQIWWCEPGGVSIRYYQGRPLGILLGAVRPDRPDRNAASALLRPVAIGLGTTLAPKQTGTLFLKINDSAAELGDNAGKLSVEVVRD